MKLLVCRSPMGLVRELGAEVYTKHLGMLISPRLGSLPGIAVELGASWAADNDCFNGLNREGFIAMLKSLSRFPNCLFVVAPDIVGDAALTLARFTLWQPVIKYFGFPVALAAQNGLEALPVPWERFEALFIGGDTRWKLGASAAALALEAKRRGKFVHMGRVNSNKRLQYATVIGCDSVDGTGYSRFSRAMIPRAVPALTTYTLPMWEGLAC